VAVPEEIPMPRTTIRNALAAVGITLLTCTVPAFSEETKNGESGTVMKPPTRMSFLVAGMMPHLTGVLKQHWDDPDLELKSVWVPRTELLNCEKHHGMGATYRIVEL